MDEKGSSEDADGKLDENVNLFIGNGISLEVSGSHHVFRKKGYARNISIKYRSQLLSYQLRDLKEVLIDRGY